VLPYKSYVPVFTQDGTDPPVVSERQNDTGLTWTWYRENPGFYDVYPNVPLDLTKVYMEGQTIGLDTGTLIPVGTGSVALLGYLKYYVDETGSRLILECWNTTLTANIEFSTMFGGRAVCLPALLIYD